MKSDNTNISQSALAEYTHHLYLQEIGIESKFAKDWKMFTHLTKSLQELASEILIIHSTPVIIIYDDGRMEFTQGSETRKILEGITAEIGKCYDFVFRNYSEDELLLYGVSKKKLRID